MKRQVFVDSCFLGYLPYLVVHILFSNKREDNIRRRSFIGTFGKPVEDFNLVVVTHLLYISPSEFADIADTQTKSINVAKYALFRGFLWRFDIILVILSHNLRRYISYNVALTFWLCIYTKKIIGQTSDGTTHRYRSFWRWYAVNKDCFMAGWVRLASTASCGLWQRTWLTM